MKKTGVWEKLNNASSDEDVGKMDVASEFENPYDSDDPFIHDVNVNDAHDENLNDDQDSLLYHEVWDDTQQAEIDEDFAQHSETPPSVDVRETHSRSSGVGLLNRAFSRCLVILLAYFWTCFCISNNGMEFLLSGLKRLLDSFGKGNNWFAGLAIAFPGTLYCFKKQLGLGKDNFKKYVVCPKCHSL